MIDVACNSALWGSSAAMRRASARRPGASPRELSASARVSGLEPPGRGRQVVAEFSRSGDGPARCPQCLTSELLLGHRLLAWPGLVGHEPAQIETFRRCLRRNRRPLHPLKRTHGHRQLSFALTVGAVAATLQAQTTSGIWSGRRAQATPGEPSGNHRPGMPPSRAHLDVGREHADEDGDCQQERRCGVSAGRRAGRRRRARPRRSTRPRTRRRRPPGGRCAGRPAGRRSGRGRRGA